MSDFPIKQGDTSPALVATLTDSDGQAVNLTGASVDFHMRPRGSDTPTVESSGNIIDSSGGKVEYPWSDGDTSNAGVYRGEFEVTYGDNTIETFPNDGYITVEIKEEIA